MRLFQKTILLLGILVMPLFAAEFIVQASGGYNGGPAFRAEGTLADFAINFPLSLRFGFGWASVYPGNAADARKIFINDATNGEPEKSGSTMDVRFDFMYPVNLLSLKQAYLYGGPRYSMFTAHFNFIGGNEVFEIKSDQWGLGAGLYNAFPISRSWALVVNAGIDYYFDAPIYGHDTLYSPDGEHQNSRKDYTFEDAAKAINQPKLEPHVMVGVQVRL
ncbi:MAG TPA: hypothetical protein ENK44_12065 [Caldithrix abyssi]|uniref:Outer membrane protein beta-barrel domain-containing protein n=1 Tax=Caldithrix abyssi TaxID=187145 RepID=A0A7V4WVP9_CALAY|nr:hypothetical protein [Caldithrix abyssi]